MPTTIKRNTASCYKLLKEQCLRTSQCDWVIKKGCKKASVETSVKTSPQKAVSPRKPSPKKADSPRKSAGHCRDVLKEYEHLFRNVIASFSGDLGLDQLLTGVSAQGLFAHRPALEGELKKALANTHPAFAATVRYSMNQRI